MAMNGVIRFALGLANMPQAEIDDLDAKLPGMARLGDAAKQLQPIMEKAEPHIAALEPLAQQALPIVKAAYPDFIAVLPTVEEFIKFVNDKKS